MQRLSALGGDWAAHHASGDGCSHHGQGWGVGEVPGLGQIPGGQRAGLCQKPEPQVAPPTGKWAPSTHPVFILLTITKAIYLFHLEREPCFSHLSLGCSVAFLPPATSLWRVCCTRPLWAMLVARVAVCGVLVRSLIGVRGSVLTSPAGLSGSAASCAIRVLGTPLGGRAGAGILTQPLTSELTRHSLHGPASLLPSMNLRERGTVPFYIRFSRRDYFPTDILKARWPRGP